MGRLAFTWCQPSANRIPQFDFNVYVHVRADRGGPRPSTFCDAEIRLADLSGDSVFVKDDAGQVYHTYSTFGRGGGEFLRNLQVSR